ncbi:MAG: hypothetical protein ACJA1M_001283 [Alphaproteobacteria bacterium]|jgi:hypothetical protein
MNNIIEMIRVEMNLNLIAIIKYSCFIYYILYGTLLISKIKDIEKKLI